MNTSVILLALIVCVSGLPAFRGGWRRGPAANGGKKTKFNKVEAVKVKKQKAVLEQNLALQTREGAECEDTGEAEDCEWWNEQGYCEHDDYKFQMKEKCAHTCGCEEVEEVEEEVVEVVKRECENKSPQEDCDWWKDQGYCTDEKLSPAMLAECPCSCEEGEVELETLLTKRETGRK